MTVAEYRERTGCDTLVETGTFKGDMIYAMRETFDRIYSIELSDRFYAKAVKNFRKYSHITILHGDSGVVLADLMPRIDSPAVFRLDAHYSSCGTARGDRDYSIY
jgi:16S rRNA A1518/A1519 N6-dimethyltransferase RsmA/KsgA/DIM1 with predicted DNA glycosylase/AP lyase activity